MSVVNHPSFQATEPCPYCESQNVAVEWYEQEFEYGKTPEILTANIPVLTCGDCAFEWSGEDADRIKHEAVCKYLGRLTPQEIKEIRERLSFNRTQFAEFCGFTEMSVGRWESGVVIQDYANDTLMRLSNDVDGIKGIRNIRANEVMRSNKNVVHFVSLDPDNQDIARRKERFQL